MGEREMESFRVWGGDGGEASWWLCRECSSQKSCHLEAARRGREIRAQIDIYRYTTAIIFSS